MGISLSKGYNQSNILPFIITRSRGANNIDGGTEQNSKIEVVGLIPARLAATRLPNKPLAEIAGKPMIQHVWERACLVSGMSLVAIATPDQEIAKVVEGFGGRAVMTSDAHRSGTDRLAEAVEILKLDDDAIVVNIQGDEPLLDPTSIETCYRLLAEEPSLQMASMRCPCPEFDLDNPACVKVVCDLQGYALYFSRARLPFPRNTTDAQVYQHIGLYAYRKRFLNTYATLPPTSLEKTEGLEQLRVLEHGYRIRLGTTHKTPIGVDTPEDLARVREMLQNP